MSRDHGHWQRALRMAWCIGAVCSCSTVAGLDDLSYGPGPAGAVCELPSDCESGVCSNGICAGDVIDGGQDAGPPGCTASWSPASVSVPIGGGVDPPDFKISATGGGTALDIQVCKKGWFTSSNIHVRFEDETLPPSGLVFWDGELSKKSAICSDKGAIGGLLGIANGEKLGGVVTIVAPPSCYGEWGKGCMLGGTCGLCWTGATTAMTRTCL